MNTIDKELALLTKLLEAILHEMRAVNNTNGAQQMPRCSSCSGTGQQMLGGNFIPCDACHGKGY